MFKKYLGDKVSRLLVADETMLVRGKSLEVVIYVVQGKWDCCWSHESTLWLFEWLFWSLIYPTWFLDKRQNRDGLGESTLFWLEWQDPMFRVTLFFRVSYWSGRWTKLVTINDSNKFWVWRVEWMSTWRLKLFMEITRFRRPRYKMGVATPGPE